MTNCKDDVNITEKPDYIWTYMECMLGPQTQTLEVAIGLSIINVILFLTGFIGNVLVCIVITNHPLLNTATDYFLMNLALSDLILLLFGLPYDILLYWCLYPWRLGSFLCQARALITEMASYVSVLTIVAFSTERYLAICHPMQHVAISNMQRSRRVILIIWLISIICAIPFAFQTGISYINYPHTSDNIILDSAFCGMLSQPVGIPLTEVSSLIFFFIPMVVIIYQYIKMGLMILDVIDRPRNFDNFGHIHGSRVQSKKVIKVLVLVVVGFFTCWSPFHIQRMTTVHLKDYSFYYDINNWLFFISGVFYYFSSTLNPILYNIMSKRMRKAFKEVLCQKNVFNSRIRRNISNASNSSSRVTSSYRFTNYVNIYKNDEVTLFKTDEI